jgi:hypothetical protein
MSAADPAARSEDGTTMTRTSRALRVPTATVAALGLLLAACGTAPDVEVAEPAGAPVPAAEAPAGEAPSDAAAEPDEATPDQPDASAEAAPEGDVPTEVDCSGQTATVDPRPAEGLPAEVAALRDLLIDAAQRCDEQLLFTAIEESARFTFSFGDGTDPLGYWWDLEAAGERPFLRLAQVLSTTPGLTPGGEVYVWPQVATGRAEHTTAEAWAELSWLDDPTSQLTGEGYLGWRAGISPDGEWRFFVAGD